VVADVPDAAGREVDEAAERGGLAVVEVLRVEVRPDSVSKEDGGRERVGALGVERRRAGRPLLVVGGHDADRDLEELLVEREEGLRCVAPRDERRREVDVARDLEGLVEVVRRSVAGAVRGPGVEDAAELRQRHDRVLGGAAAAEARDAAAEPLQQEWQGVLVAAGRARVIRDLGVPLRARGA